MKDVRELLTVNSTSLSMVCSVFKRRTEETGQMLDKWRGDRPKSCLQLKGTSLRISKNTKRHEMELRDASGPWGNPINDYQKMISVEGDCQGLTEWQKRERCSGGGSVMARAAFLSVVLTILLKLMNYQHRKVLPNFNPPCNTRWKAWSQTHLPVLWKHTWIEKHTSASVKQRGSSYREQNKRLKQKEHEWREFRLCKEQRWSYQILAAHSVFCLLYLIFMYVYMSK